MGIYNNKKEIYNNKKGNYNNKKGYPNKRRTFRAEKKRFKEIKPKKILIGLVHADSWCGHCIELKPKWHEMYEKLKKDKKYKYRFTMEIFNENDETKRVFSRKRMMLFHKDLATEAEGYPFIFRIKSGVLEKYDGEREIGPMIKWFFDEKDMEGEEHIKVDANDGKLNIFGLFKGGYQDRISGFFGTQVRNKTSKKSHHSKKT